MRATLGRWLEAIRTSFWFLPMLMLGCAAALALLLLHADRNLDPGTKSSFDWAYSGGPEGARSLLSTIAGSMITAASVTFSLASVALSIASQQYGSRVLRNFMRDRITQVLLGTFIATFIYSVLVVRTIRGSDFSGGFVPAISVTMAIVLALISLVLLIYFIHHVSASIQASHIVRVIAEDLSSAIPRLYPSQTGQPTAQAPDLERLQQRDTVSPTTCRSGYLQTIDLDTLLEEMQKHDWVARMLVRPGDHLLDGTALLKVYGPSRLDDDLAEKLQGCFYLNRERTPSQDIRYQFQQLTDVVVRALSPGINDPFTAVNGIDEIAAALLQFLQRANVSDERVDEKGVLRLIVPAVGIAELLTDTVGHIAIYGADDHFVMDSLRRVLSTVEPHLRRAEDVARAQQLFAELDMRQRAKAPKA